MLGCTDPLAPNYDSEATDDNGSCVTVLPGCTDSGACNFNPLATENDGSCEYTTCAGCLDPTACNFGDWDIADNEQCFYAPEFSDCGGNCLNDFNDDGICDEFDVYGCLDELACNYNPDANLSAFCEYPIANFDCDGFSLRPIFTAFPANADVDACNVPSVEDAVVQAIVSPYAESCVAF